MRNPTIHPDLSRNPGTSRRNRRASSQRADPSPARCIALWPSFFRVTLILASLGSAGCSGGTAETPIDTSAISELTRADSVAQIVTSLPARHARPRKLSPVADTIAHRLVFLPATQTWFLGAVRDKLFGVDVGRVDIDLQKPPGRMAAFAEAAEATSPYEVGTRVRVRGAWGEEDSRITAFGVSGNRLLARVTLSPAAESAFAATPTLMATVERVASESAPRTSTCNRTPSVDLTRRLSRAADSLLASLRAGEQPVFTRLQKSMVARKSTIAGCFGSAAGIAIASLSAGDYQWVRERAVLVGDSGRRALPVRDLRFRSHEVLQAFDADGDGIDDVAARAWTPRATGMVVLRFIDGSKLERLAAGFSVER